MSKQFQAIEPAKLKWDKGLPHSSLYDDIYFSTEQGLEESTYVFLEGNSLVSRFQSFGPEHSSWPNFVIGECGFGTGLNFLLTLQLFNAYAAQGARLHFFSAEKHPLIAQDLEKCLALWPALADEGRALLSVYPAIHTPGYHHCEVESQRVYLHLLLGDAREMFENLVITNDPILEARCRSWQFDAWFLDGFSPDKNPHMWADSLLTSIAILSKPGTTLATFTSAGWVRRALARVGFRVKKIKGYGRKRQMSIATFEGIPFTPRKRHTPWHIAALRRPCEKKAIVLGAGLAGCFVAHELARLHWDVTLIEQEKGEGLQASNNSSAVLYPNLSIYEAPLTHLMLHAYTHALRVYQPWINEGLIEGELHGVLQLVTNEKMHRHHLSLDKWLQSYPALGRLVDVHEACELAGVELKNGGLYLPHAGWINAKSLCAFLIRSSRIQSVFSQSVDDFKSENGVWHVGGYEAPVLVVATGFRASMFTATQSCTVFPFKGQMTGISPTAWSHTLKIPVCADGHIAPMREGIHWMGATYHPKVTDLNCNAADDVLNMTIYQALAASSEGVSVKAHWAGIRASTRDHLPFVGSVPTADFMTDFMALHANNRRFIPSTAQCHEGLYLCAGFGSRGLTTIPWASTYLAALIDHQPFACARAMAKSLSPVRSVSLQRIFK